MQSSMHQDGRRDGGKVKRTHYHIHKTHQAGLTSCLAALGGQVRELVGQLVSLRLEARAALLQRRHLPATDAMPEHRQPHASSSTTSTLAKARNGSMCVYVCVCVCARARAVFVCVYVPRRARVCMCVASMAMGACAGHMPPCRVRGEHAEGRNSALKGVMPKSCM